MLRPGAFRGLSADAVVTFATLGLVATGAALAGRAPIDAAVRDAGAALPGVALLASMTLILFTAIELIDRGGRVDREATRKLGHVGAGGIALLAPAVLPSHWAMLLLTAGFALLLLASRWIGVLGPLHPEGRRGAGDLTYPAGLYAAFVLAGPNVVAFAVAVAVLALADPAAALAGRRWGARRFVAFGTPRSVEGTAAFAAVALAVSLTAFLAFGGAPMPSVLRAIAVASATAVAEAFSPSGLDNLTIPVAAVLVLGTAS